MQQRGLTIVFRVKPNRVQELKDLLNPVGENIDEQDFADFYGLKTVHFLRLVVLDPAVVRGEEIPPQLVLSTNFSGSLSEHLDDLLAHMGTGLETLLGFSVDAPPAMDRKDLREYLLSHRMENAAFYCGSVGRSAEQIRKEDLLQRHIQAHLRDKYPAQIWPADAGPGLNQEIRSALSHGDLNPRLYAAPPAFWRVMGIPLLALAVLTGLGLYGWAWWAAPWITLGATLLVVGMVAAWWMALRRLEEKDREAFQATSRDAHQIALLHRREDYLAQNQITHLVEVKPGRIRLWTLKFVLGAINLLARTVFNRGKLGGIASIHFARWVLIDGGKRLLFFSNYDGSWESYLGEFVDRAAVGLTGVWSNTVGFPPTRKLIFEGARRSQEFKAWVRAHQIETQIWFSAYKDLSINNVNQNSRLARGLLRRPGTRKLRRWLESV